MWILHCPNFDPFVITINASSCALIAEYRLLNVVTPRHYQSPISELHRKVQPAERLARIDINGAIRVAPSRENDGNYKKCNKEKFSQRLRWSRRCSASNKRQSCRVRRREYASIRDILILQRKSRVHLMRAPLRSAPDRNYDKSIVKR